MYREVQHGAEEVPATWKHNKYGVTVVDPGKGVCADPVNGGAILGKGGTGPQRREQGASVGPRQGKG